MLDFEDNKELVVCSKPPVNGNICVKFLAVANDLSYLTYTWCDDNNEFIVEGTDCSTTYQHLERCYSKFIWVKHEQ